MIVFDTDHLTVLQIGKGDRFDRLSSRLERSNETQSTTIVNVEEQMRGWLASIAKERNPERQIRVYRELVELFRRFAHFPILSFDEPAAQWYTQLRTGRGHLGMRDLKIASITLTQNATLLTANRRDFEQIPGLCIENWLDGELSWFPPWLWRSANSPKRKIPRRLPGDANEV